MKKQTEIQLNYAKAEFIQTIGKVKNLVGDNLSKFGNFLKNSSEKDLEKSDELYDKTNKMVIEETNQNNIKEV